MLTVCMLTLLQLGQLRAQPNAYNSALDDCKKILWLDSHHFTALGLRGKIHQARLELEYAAFCFSSASQCVGITQEQKAEMQAAEKRTREMMQEIRDNRSRSRSRTRTSSASPARSTLSAGSADTDYYEVSELSKRVVKDTLMFEASQLLGLPRNATDAQISSARRQALFICTHHLDQGLQADRLLPDHPDRPTADADRFDQVNAASEVLLDTNKRAAYDASRGRGCR